MDSMDNVRERCEALPQWTAHWQPQTRPGLNGRRWWPLAWLVAAVAVLGLALALPLFGPGENLSLPRRRRPVPHCRHQSSQCQRRAEHDSLGGGHLYVDGD